MSKTECLSKVSIVIANYNGEAFAHQMVKNLSYYYELGCELVLVDDGSSSKDSTVEIFQEVFPDGWVIRQTNGGVASARNTGVRAATREFIQLYDIDDLILAGKLEAQVPFMMANEADVVFSDWRYVNHKKEGEKTYEPWTEHESSEANFEDLFHGLFLPNPSCLIRKTTYWELDGIDEELGPGEDTDFFLRMALLKKKLLYLPGNYFEYHLYSHITTASKASDLHKKCNIYIHMLTKTLMILQSGYKTSDSQIDMTAVELFIYIRTVMLFDRKAGLNAYRKLKNMVPDFRPRRQSALFMSFYRLFGFRTATFLSRILVKAKPNVE